MSISALKIYNDDGGVLINSDLMTLTIKEKIPLSSIAKVDNPYYKQNLLLKPEPDIGNPLYFIGEERENNECRRLSLSTDFDFIGITANRTFLNGFHICQPNRGEYYIYTHSSMDLSNIYVYTFSLSLNSKGAEEKAGLRLYDENGKMTFNSTNSMSIFDSYSDTCIYTGFDKVVLLPVIWYYYDGRYIIDWVDDGKSRGAMQTRFYKDKLLIVGWFMTWMPVGIYAEPTKMYFHVYEYTSALFLKDVF